MKVTYKSAIADKVVMCFNQWYTLLPVVTQGYSIVWLKKLPTRERSGIIVKMNEDLLKCA